MSRQGNDTSQLSYSWGVEDKLAGGICNFPHHVMQVEEDLSTCQYIEIGRISSNGQLIDGALVASMITAL